MGSTEGTTYQRRREYMNFRKNCVFLGPTFKIRFGPQPTFRLQNLDPSREFEKPSTKTINSPINLMLLLILVV